MMKADLDIVSRNVLCVLTERVCLNHIGMYQLAFRCRYSVHFSARAGRGNWGTLGVGGQVLEYNGRGARGARGRYLLPRPLPKVP